MNELQYESSPYLLQHAQNPVNWKAWNEKSLSLASDLDKLLIVSIGYSTCHWCHVMEHECFQDREVAGLMNEHFVSIKVDREERPDVDAHYMKAVQEMTQRGGWPLNVVCLPDGRPVWGGTYFNKPDWLHLLTSMHDLFIEKPQALYDIAKQLDVSIAKTAKGPIPIGAGDSLDFTRLLEEWVRYFDREYGGYGQAPKFMIPNSLAFLQKLSHLNHHKTSLDFVDLTLTRMAWGGLFDTVQGGFARYSVDKAWHIPHFEKMLYDNAQLLSLYADGFKRTANPLYREVIEKTTDFITAEWSNGRGGFYSAYDADSLNRKGEPEEGAFYSWTAEELLMLIGEADFPLFQELFNIYPSRMWENGKYVLLQSEHTERIAARHQLPPEELIRKKRAWEKQLKNAREKRRRPRLDDKSLTSWNALLITGWLDAFSTLEDKRYLVLAVDIHRFLSRNLLDEELNLKRTYKQGRATIDAFLEDYAFFISALIALYEHTLDTHYLKEAKALTDKTIDDFFDEESRFFFFNNKKKATIIRNSIETEDNVIPSANSQMAHNLLKLGLIFEEARYDEIAGNMIQTMRHHIHYPPYYSNWLAAELYFANPSELLVSGNDALKEVLELRRGLITKTVLLGNEKETHIPYFSGKRDAGKTLFYYCFDRACLPPQDSKEFLKDYTL